MLSREQRIKVTQLLSKLKSVLFKLEKELQSDTKLNSEVLENFLDILEDKFLFSISPELLMTYRFGIYLKRMKELLERNRERIPKVVIYF